MGSVPAKFFPAPIPYGSSPAANVLNPTQPAAQNAQQPLLPPNFQDPGKMQAQPVAQNVPQPASNLAQRPRNPFDQQGRMYGL